MSPVAIYLLALAGVFGLVIGSFLNVVIHRVPAGIPLTRPSRCPRCDAPVRPWQNVPVVSWLALRGRCASCDIAISPRYPLVESATAAAFALVVWVVLDADPAMTGAPTPGAVAAVAAALLYFAAISIALTLIDLDLHRLPNAIVLPSYVVALGLFALACLFGSPWTALGRAAVGGAALYAFYLALRFVRPGGMGGGDVKLAGVIGLYLGWLGWGPLIVGGFAGFVLGGVFGIALMLFRRAGRSTAIPFGPWMIAGAWVGILAGGQLAQAYIGLLVP